MKCSFEKGGKGPLGKYFFPGILLAAGLIVLVQLLLPSSWQIQCLLERWSGIPCPTCGGTRCAQLILAGDFLSAFKMQPLVFFALFLLTGALIYSLAAVWPGLPFVRIRLENRRERIAVLGLLVAPVVLNWIYLICRG